MSRMDGPRAPGLLRAFCLVGDGMCAPPAAGAMDDLDDEFAASMHLVDQPPPMWNGDDDYDPDNFQPDASKSTANMLWAAAETGDDAGVESALQRGADVDACDLRDGYGAVLIAAENGHVGVLRTLRKAGASLELADSFGRTPLYAASAAGRLDCVKYLAQRGAVVDAPDADGRTPFFAACALRDLDSAALLFELGADINLADIGGQTAFAFAAANGYADVLELLRRLGVRETLGRLDMAAPREVEPKKAAPQAFSPKPSPKASPKTSPVSAPVLPAAAVLATGAARPLASLGGVAKASLGSAAKKLARHAGGSSPLTSPKASPKAGSRDLAHAALPKWH
ncbi:ankyrin repeat-containing domain protein [Pelagophyceae sp. CCMP2097]|nr:ankyrin repeat-containing domain protein [Pelagophyceae sp. CCMP2097]